MAQLIKLIKKVFTNLYFLFFLNGFILASLLHVLNEDIYEKKLFNSIAKKIRTELGNENKDSFLLRSLHMTYQLQVDRQPVFGDMLESNKTEFIHSATTDLMTAYGACGSYSIVLARILKANNCKVRIGQMKVNGKFGGHIVVETEINNKWIIVDPMFNIAFIKPDGRFADFKEVHNNWVFYKKQVPANYDTTYKYEGIRYTNWDKIPIVLPAFKKLLDLTIGQEKTDKLSLRPYLLRAYHILFVFGCFLYGILSISTLWLIRKRKYYNGIKTN